MTTTVYRYFDTSDRLLYVGITGNQYSRIEDHAKNRSWWADVEYGKFIHYPTRQEALAAETRAIAEEIPKYNKAGPTINADAYGHLVDLLQEKLTDEWHLSLNLKYDKVLRDVYSFSTAAATYQLVFALDYAIDWDADGNERLIDCEQCKAIVDSRWFEYVQPISQSICDEWVAA